MGIPILCSIGLNSDGLFVRASPAGRCIASARPNASDRTGAPVSHAPAVRRKQTDASGLTHRSTKFGSPIRRRGQTRCLPMSSCVGIGPAWQRLSKAGRAAWPSALPRHLDLCCGIGSLLRRPTHAEVTSIPALVPLRRHPMPSCLFKPAAPGQSSTSTLPSSPPFFSTQPHGPWSEELDRGEGG
jgi:hypothetical protein